MKFHSVSELFPLMEGEEFDRLVSDISTHGLLERIWTHPDDGSIIDGRNRYRACIQAKVEPQTREWDGAGSLVEFVVSLNLHRRHLDVGQKACIAVAIEPLLAEEARKRQLAQLKQGDKPPVSANLHGRDKGRSDEKAGAVVGVSARSVSDAKALKKAAPDLFQKVSAGEMTLTSARRIAQRTEAKEAAALPSEKYRVLYADPPWKYGDQLTEDYGPTKFHYPAMTHTELSNLPVADIATDDAVLFLWVTSPLLPDAFPIIKAWGFDYRASFVWDKVKHNMGHYNSVRHELLLVCVRGSCMPDVPELVDSVQSIERKKHSEKPEEFRAIIDKLYPSGKRIELFARAAAAGWDRWGNQS